MTSFADIPQEIIDKINNYVFYMEERDKLIGIKKEYNKMITTINIGWTYDGVSWIPPYLSGYGVFFNLN